MNTTALATTIDTDHAVILFDGVCNLCNGSVNFIIDRDPDGYFKFASLQSDEAAPLLARHQLKEGYLDSIVLVEGEKVYRNSTAALRVARKLKGGWPLFSIFLIIPRPLRDLVYNFIARNRYKWFGKSDTCRIPTPELRSRFL